MSDSEQWVSRSAIIAYAHSQGVAISATQLRRWHKNGLLPRPRRFPRREGRGTETHYPIEAAALAVFIAQACKIHRDLDIVAWLAWTAGHPVTTRVRATLVTNLDREIAYLNDGLDAFENGDEDNPIEQSIKGRRPKGLRPVRRQLLSTLTRVSMEVRGGRFRADGYEPGDLAHLLRLMSVKSTDAALADEGTLGRMLDILSHEISAERMRSVLASMSDARLERRLADAKRIWRLADTTGELAKYQMPYGLFAAVMVATHGSKYARLARRWMHRRMHEMGLDTLEQVIAHVREERASRPIHAPDDGKLE